MHLKQKFVALTIAMLMAAVSYTHLSPGRIPILGTPRIARDQDRLPEFLERDFVVSGRQKAIGIEIRDHDSASGNITLTG